MTVVRSAAAGVVLACAFILARPLSAANLPEITSKILKELNFEESMLSGLDQELKVSDEWVASAKKEGSLRLTGSWDPDEFKAQTAPFVARYPFIKLSYSRGSFQARALKPLLAAKEGRYIADVVSGIGGALTHYFEADLLDDLRVLPNAKNVPDGMKDDKGRWIGIRIRHWCLAYNTQTVRKADLPEKWDDLLTNPRWKGGKLAVNNLPQVWLLPLWGEFGPEWGTKFMTGLFNDVRPQLRKEGANALLGLLAAGEFDAAIPAGDYRIGEMIDDGAPIGWHCPLPVPTAISEMAVLKGSPNINSARIFTNWLLSKEGQIAQFRYEHAPPIHRELQLPIFQRFPEQTVGRKIAFRDPALGEEEHAKLLEVWNPLWEQPR